MTQSRAAPAVMLAGGSPDFAGKTLSGHHFARFSDQNKVGKEGMLTSTLRKVGTSWKEACDGGMRRRWSASGEEGSLVGELQRDELPRTS